MTMRAKANRREPQRKTRSSSSGVFLSRLEDQRRTSRRATPPGDPGLRAFLEELGRMAADAVLERMQNTLSTKTDDKAFRKTLRGIYSKRRQVEGSD